MARSWFNAANTDTSRDIENNEFWAMWCKFDTNSKYGVFRHIRHIYFNQQHARFKLLTK